MLEDPLDLLSIDENSTTETVSSETTLILNASKCVYCSKILGYQGRFGSVHKYHYACLENQNCIYCGNNGLLNACEELACLNVFHIFCLQKFCPKSNLDHKKCLCHSEKKKFEKSLENKLKIRRIANSINNDSAKLNEIFNNKPKNIENQSYGAIFWAIIGNQYFEENGKINKAPIFYMKKNKFNKCNTGKNWVNSKIKNLSKEFKCVKKQNKLIFEEILPKKGKKVKKVKMSEEELLLSESKSSLLRTYKNEFISYSESFKQEKTIKSREKACEICLESEEEDSIILCSKCQVKVHLQCYGLPKDTFSFICAQCEYSISSNKSCALCPVTTGVLKPSLTAPSKKFMSHLQSPSSTPLWCHIFCVQQLNVNCFLDRINLTQIDLKLIPKRLFSHFCEVCKTFNGAALQCEGPECQKFFHPECAKNKGMYFGKHYDNENTGIYCENHKPFSLRQLLEEKGKKTYMDFLNFIKTLEKIEKELKIQKNSEEISYAEKFELYEYFDRIVEEKIGKFEIVIKKKKFGNYCRKTVKENCEFVNFIDPALITSEKLQTEFRDHEELKEFYEKNIFEIMVNEYKILKIPVMPCKRNREE